MAYISDFNVNDVAAVLDDISQRLARDSKERDAIELAQIVLLYTRHIRREDDFGRYYKEFFDPSFRVKISHGFSTREEADRWLASGEAREAEFVTIAGKGFQVARMPGRLTFIDRPLPEELEAEGTASGSSKG